MGQRLAPVSAYSVIHRSDDTDSANPLRTFSFYLAICLIVIKFGMVQEIQAQLMGFNGKLLYLFGIPAIVGVIIGGGIARVFSVRTGIYWGLFALWLIIGTPFSTWKGGSAPRLTDFLKADLIMIFVVGGLVTNWRECKKLAAAIGIAGLLNVISGRVFAGDMSGRYGLEFGTVSNPNDFAAHLVLVLPFVMYLLVTPRNILIRVAAAIGLCAGLFMALKTGSRGGEVGILVDAFLFLIAGNSRRRISIICLAPVAVIALLIALPSDVIQRLHSFSASDQTASLEALDSSEARNYVFRKSLQYTLEFPIFGLGMDQFATWEGGHNTLIGTHGYWHGAHNSFTQASSEGGIPAGILLIAAWASTFLVLRRVNRQARVRSDCGDIEVLSFYAMVAVAGFMVAIFFLNFAYFFYGPAMGGFAIAVKRSAEAEMAKRAALQPAIA